MEKFEFLNIEAEISNRKIGAKCTGSLAPVAQPLLDYLIKVLNSIKVIATKDGKNIYNLYNPPQPTKAGMRALERKIKEKLFGMVFPATANLAVTLLCQCSCVHCSADLFKNREKKDLSTEEMKRVIDSALGLGSNLVIFVGGEPLLNKDIFELIRYVDKDKAIVSIFTNGQLLTEENVKRLADSGLHCLYLSIDSIDPETHNSLRGVKHLFQAGVEGTSRARIRDIHRHLHLRDERNALKR